MFCTSEIAVRLPPADKIVVPTPPMLPTVYVPESNWSVAVVAEVNMSEAAEIWPVEVNSNVPPLIIVSPVYGLAAIRVERAGAGLG